MKKRLFSLLLAVLMLCSLAPGAFAAELTPAASWNNNAQSYHQGGWAWDAPSGYYTLLRHAEPVCSYLFAQGSGFCRVEYIPGDAAQLVVETYSADRKIQTQKQLNVELPLFGGFFAGADANYVVFGQENLQESESAEIIRVVKYSKSFQRLGSASIRGNNTIVPFDAGSLRMTEDGTFLYVHTAHQMYTTSDGLNHQANLTFIVRESDLAVTDIRSSIMNCDYGYVSHSFNQYVVLDGDQLVTLDHGDAGRTRSAYLYRCAKADSNGQCLPSFDDFRFGGEGIDLMVFPSTQEHYNATGASLGGLVATGTHYLAAGSSVDAHAKNLSLDESQRNIFVCAVPKDRFAQSAVQTYWLTSYPGDAAGDDLARVSTPHLVSLPDGRALILWTLDNTLFYQFLAADGRPIGSVRSREGALSDCAPTVIRGLVQWYVTNGGEPTFYAIDPNEEAHTKHEWGKFGAVEPTCMQEGYSGDTVCLICGAVRERGSALPALGHDFGPLQENEAPTCTDYGWGHRACSRCDEYQYEEIPPLGHRWSAWRQTIAPTQESTGSEERTCTVCGETVSRIVPELGHVHTLWYVEHEDPGCYWQGREAYWMCSDCGRLFSDADGQHEIDEPEYIPALGHDEQVTEVTPPTCTEDGYTIYTCTRCGESRESDRVPATGHSWGAWKVTRPATTEAEGEETRVCSRCGEKQTRGVSKLKPAPAAPCDGGASCPSRVFTDVKRSGWYHLAVDWAVTEKVTSGLTKTTFGPGESCTRAQMVTFLWRAAGAEEPTLKTHNFVDVPAGKFYTKAVLWALENHITTGTDKTHFSPDAHVSRAQTVTFLWRLEGQPAAKGASFSDVPAGKYYADAVVWAAVSQITTGVGNNRFAPNADCTRAEIVTFLYRDLA